MSASPPEDGGEAARLEAANWFAKMRGPDAERWAPKLAAWRAEHRAHEEAYARLLQRWDQSAFLTNSALGRNRDLSRVAIWGRRRSMLWGSAVAAFLLLIVGIGALTAVKERALAPAVASVTYTSGTGQLRPVAFQDGSRIILDADSAIAVEDKDGQRHFELIKGRARFEPASASHQLWIVNSQSASAIANNGVFDVSRAGGTVRVIAWRGQIEVQGAPKPGQPDRSLIRLIAAHQVAFEPAPNPPTTVAANPREYDWPTGMLSFDRIRLNEAVETMNRYNATKIDLRDAAIGSRRITGAFRATEPQNFARAVAAMFGLALSTSSDGTIVIEPAIKA